MSQCIDIFMCRSKCGCMDTCIESCMRESVNTCIHALMYKHRHVLIHV